MGHGEIILGEEAVLLLRFYCAMSVGFCAW